MACRSPPPTSPFTTPPSMRRSGRAYSRTARAHSMSRMSSTTGTSKTAYLDIGVPVFDENSKRFIGAVRAFVDVSPLFSMLHRDQAGRTLATVLVTRDGTVISAPNVDASLHMKSEEYRAVRDALGTLQGRQAGYLLATLPWRQPAGRLCRHRSDAHLSQPGVVCHGRPERARSAQFGSHAGVLRHFHGARRAADGVSAGRVLLPAS